MNTTHTNGQRQYVESQVKQAAAAIARQLGPDATYYQIGQRLTADFPELDFSAALMFGLQALGLCSDGQEPPRELEAGQVGETSREPESRRRRQRCSRPRRSTATGRIGRPRLPEDRLRTYRLQIRLSQTERGMIERAAEQLCQPVGEWVRGVVLRAIDRHMPECKQEAGRGRPGG
jgi:hypothetical protein